MRFEGTEYIISKESCGECIAISKKALEEWRYHYNVVADEYNDEPYCRGLYLGKADALTEILKHFDEEE